jgi:tRNA guanosine-2'-O-methyltransferase
MLVLGDEKLGIPVTILQQMDVCLQIPQSGVLRSLNCHVSGALAVWEYTRQQLNSASNSATADTSAATRNYITV